MSKCWTWPCFSNFACFWPKLESPVNTHVGAQVSIWVLVGGELIINIVVSIWDLGHANLLLCYNANYFDSIESCMLK